MAKMTRPTSISRAWLLLFLAVLLIAHPFKKAMAAKSANAVATDSDSDSDNEEVTDEPESEVAEPEAGESSLTENYGEGEENEGYEGGEGGEEEAPPEDEEDGDVDESDVVVLTEKNYNETLSKNEFVLVEFYAPWCGHCKSLKPQYAKAATTLKSYDSKIVLAKVDSTKEESLSQTNGVEGFPTLFWFENGVKKSYSGGRQADEIVNWVKKRTGPAAVTLSTVEEVKKFLEENSESGIGFFEKLEGKEWEHFQQLAKNDDHLVFAQTTSQEVATAAGIKSAAPTFVIIKAEEEEKISPFEGEFSFEVLSKFVSGNKLSTITVFSTATAEKIFGSPIKRQLLFFVPEDKEETYLPIYRQACSTLKGDVICVHVKSSTEESQQVYEFFGIEQDAIELFGYTTLEESKKFHFGQEVTVDNMVAWGREFAAGNVEATFKSEPIPETNDEDVKVVVGKTFEEIVLDESKDVLLEAYAPWCGHCQQLEPVYKKLGKRFRTVSTVVIAKIDATKNEHHRLEAQGYPTILFFPAGKKDEDPIPFEESNRSLKHLTAFIKKNAAIPFVLEKKKKTKDATPVGEEPAAEEELKELEKDKKEAAAAEVESEVAESSLHTEL